MSRQITGRKGRRAVQKNQRVDKLAVEVLARQAGARAKQTGEPLEEALEAGRQIREPCDGPHGDERAERWQEDLAHKRAREQKRGQTEERKRADQAVVWERFMRAEFQELEKRKAGQLARLLGEPLAGESPAALERLASEDRRQAQEGLVALMSGGKVSYKRVEELCEGDMPARTAANRLRTTWLKERRDGWLGPDGRM
jgi:hypothetical protein